MIMNANLFYQKNKILFIGFVAFNLVLSCGSFQSASYFESDGIYVSKSTQVEQIPQEENNYYSQYFKEVADGNLAISSNNTFFTDTESYSSTDQYQTNTIENSYNQIPWGGEKTQTEIIIVNNSPNYLWGLSGFGFNYSPIWNNFYGNRFRFGYGDFYDPFFTPFGGGFAGYWGGFNSFYSPFNYIGGFYNPYSFRNPWNRNNLFNRNGYVNGFGNRYNNNNKDYNSTIARIKSGRGEKSYESSERNSKAKENLQSNSNDAEIQGASYRINSGRGYNSLGRNIVLGNNRLRVKNSEGSITSRPNVNPRNSATTSVIGNGNISPNNSVKRSNGRFSQSRYSSVPKNRSNTNSTITKSPIQKTRTITRPNTTRQYNNNSYIKSNSSGSKNYSTPARSFSSGSSGRSSSGRSSSGRGSSGGRRN
jgi:hypothetical protein